MKTKLTLFGRQFDMASRARRRKLVVFIYLGFAALILVGWALDRWGVLGAGLILFSSYISKLILGGYGTEGRGLVKPFLGNEVRARYDKNPNSHWSKLASITIPKIADDPEFLSDEREVRSRDSAHEVAYRGLGMVVIVTFLVAYLEHSGSRLLAKIGVILPIACFDQLIYGLLICLFILFLTLPQAILLWTEPDMEEEPS